MSRTQSLALGLSALVLMVDQGTKAWALSRLVIEGASLRLPGPVDVTLSFNLSNSFGLAPVVGDLTRWALSGANLTAAVVILGLILRGGLRPTAMVGLSLVMAGAVGNAIDRIRLGAVVDVIDASKIGFVWIFNSADAAIDLGLVFLALSALRGRRANAP